MTVDEIIAGFHLSPECDTYWNRASVAALVAEIERLRRDDAAMRATIKDMNDTIRVAEDDQIARERETEWRLISLGGRRALDGSSTTGARRAPTEI